MDPKGKGAVKGPYDDLLRRWDADACQARRDNAIIVVLTALGLLSYILSVL